MLPWAIFYWPAANVQSAAKGQATALGKIKFGPNVKNRPLNSQLLTVDYTSIYNCVQNSSIY